MDHTHRENRAKLDFYNIYHPTKSYMAEQDY